METKLELNREWILDCNTWTQTRLQVNAAVAHYLIIIRRYYVRCCCKASADALKCFFIYKYVSKKCGIWEYHGIKLCIYNLYYTSIHTQVYIHIQVLFLFFCYTETLYFVISPATIQSQFEWWQWEWQLLALTPTPQWSPALIKDY